MEKALVRHDVLSISQSSCSQSSLSRVSSTIISSSSYSARLLSFRAFTFTFEPWRLTSAHERAARPCEPTWAPIQYKRSAQKSTWNSYFLLINEIVFGQYNSKRFFQVVFCPIDSGVEVQYWKGPISTELGWTFRADIFWLNRDPASSEITSRLIPAAAGIK